jgi:hypothetical protein
VAFILGCSVAIMAATDMNEMRDGYRDSRGRAETRQALIGAVAGAVLSLSGVAVVAIFIIGHQSVYRNQLVTPLAPPTASTRPALGPK